MYCSILWLDLNVITWPRTCFALLLSIKTICHKTRVLHGMMICSVSNLHLISSPSHCAEWKDLREFCSWGFWGDWTERRQLVSVGHHDQGPAWVSTSYIPRSIVASDVERSVEWYKPSWSGSFWAILHRTHMYRIQNFRWGVSFSSCLNLYLSHVQKEITPETPFSTGISIH